MISHEISRWDILSHLTCVRSFRIKWICSAWKIHLLGKGSCCLQNLHRQLHLGLWQRQKGMKTRSGSSSTARYKVMKFVTFNTPLHNLGPSKYTKVRKFATAVLTFISYCTVSIQNYHIVFNNWKIKKRGDLVLCHPSLTDWLTTSEDRATQLLRIRSGALFTQYKEL